MLEADRRSIEGRIVTRLLLSVIASSVFFFAAPPLMGQVPVVRIEEAGSLERDEAQVRFAPSLRWEEKREILLAEGIFSPPAPPSQFTLTARTPYKVPGGALNLNMKASQRPGAWRTGNHGQRAGWISFRPGGGNDHTVDEWIDLPTLALQTKRAAILMARLPGRPIS